MYFTFIFCVSPQCPPAFESHTKPESHLHTYKLPLSTLVSESRALKPIEAD